MKADGTAPAFEGWAIVELLGHRRLAGYVREAEMFGGKLMRLDVPELPAELARGYYGARPAQPGFTQYFGVGSLYCLTPTTEELARKFAQQMRPEPPVRLETRPALAEVADEDEIVPVGGEPADEDMPA